MRTVAPPDKTSYFHAPIATSVVVSDHILELQDSAGDTLLCTEDQEICTLEGWVRAGNLQAFQKIYAVKGTFILKPYLTRVAKIGYGECYGLTLDTDNGYIANGFVVRDSAWTLENIKQKQLKQP